jgi:hypothetical protein
MQWQKTPADVHRAFDAALPKAEEKPRKKAR